MWEGINNKIRINVKKLILNIAEFIALEVLKLSSKIQISI